MEHINSDGTEVFTDENTATLSQNNTGELEGSDHSGFRAGEFDTEFGKLSCKVPFSLEVKQELCCRESCPCGNKLTYPNYISFVSPNKNLRGHCDGWEEQRKFDPLSSFHRNATFFNIPTNLRSAQLFFENRKNKLRTRSVNNVEGFLLECPSASWAGDVFVSPSGHWVFDSVMGNLKARALFESSLFFQLGVLDGKMNQVRSRSTNSRLIKSAELNCSPFGQSVLQKTRVQIVPLEKQKPRSVSDICQRKPEPCSSTNSTCSHLSIPSREISYSKGLLYCVWKSGIPYFVFSLDNDSGEVYMANPQKIESSVHKALDYVYLFRLRTDSKRNSRIRCNTGSSFVGKMKVSSSIVLNSNRAKHIETEFVLFGSHEDHSREMQSSSSTQTKSKRLSKKVAKILKSSHSLKHRSSSNIGEPISRLNNLMLEMFAGDSRDLGNSGHDYHLAEDFQTNLELAAIIVKDYQQDRNKETIVGGWGLKFLDKIENCGVITSQETSFSCEVCKGSCRRNCGDCTRRMDVLVPANFHGGPINMTGGPSSLTERWRSGGHCDCGGWDIGCPLTVLNNHFLSSKASSQEESEEDCQSVSLFVEGTQHGEPTLRMVNTTNEGLYVVHFQSTLSALQTFSVAVAMIHTKTPDLYPNM